MTIGFPTMSRVTTPSFVINKVGVEHTTVASFTIDTSRIYLVSAAVRVYCISSMHKLHHGRTAQFPPPSNSYVVLYASLPLSYSLLFSINFLYYISATDSWERWALIVKFDEGRVFYFKIVRKLI